MAISKVKSVQGSGSFESEYGAIQPNGKKLLFTFEYEMEDGTIVKANHKTNVSPFPAGTQVEYEITKEHPQHGKSGKVFRPKEEPSGDMTKDDWRKKDIAIIYQSSIKSAIDFLASKGYDNGSPDITQVCSTADAIAKFVINKSNI